MVRSARLVTSDGIRVLAQDDEFFAILRRLAPDIDPLDFAIHNLGFIKFQVLDDGVMTIELDPRKLDRRAVLRAERLITESGARLFRVNRLGVEKELGPTSAPAETIAYLHALHAPPDTFAAGERFAVTSRDVVTLLRKTDHPFCRLAQRWCAASGAFDDSLISFAGANDLLDRLVVFAGAPGGAPVIRFIGEGHSWLAAQDRVRLLGEPAANLPDREYGAWVSAYHRIVAESGEPRFDAVSATFINAASALYSIRYDRLLLPWKTAGDEIRVTMVSRVFWRGDSSAVAPATRH